MKILVVDDSPTVRAAIRKELRNEGYEVVEAENGTTALELAKKIHPELITLDLEMPKMNGFETCKQFHDQGMADVPLIFITNQDNLEDRAKGFEYGAMDYIGKPFAKGEIRNAVNQILKPEKKLKGLTALIVDDDNITRLVLKKTLEREGLTVIEANDGTLAYEVMKKQMDEIDIIISDLMMPQMNGDQLCKKIRRELNQHDIPVIFLTAKSDRSELLFLFKAGGTDYIIKPFVKEELLARITVHLEKNKLNKSLRKTTDLLNFANEEIRQLSITDVLTSCFNSHYLLEQLEKEINRAARYNRFFSMLLCDIDHFKSINDTYGHQAGDIILESFAHCLRGELREKLDWIARHGGEGFMIILPETDMKGLKAFAERLRAVVTERKIQINNKDIYITAGFGGTSIDSKTPEKNLTVTKLINFADELLHQSKKKGRNSITISKPG
ncbi:MAG: response regulator [bacterium]|nr:response regulator [bacterium]